MHQTATWSSTVETMLTKVRAAAHTTRQKQNADVQSRECLSQGRSSAWALYMWRFSFVTVTSGARLGVDGTMEAYQSGQITDLMQRLGGMFHITSGEYACAGSQAVRSAQDKKLLNGARAFHV